MQKLHQASIVVVGIVFCENIATTYKVRRVSMTQSPLLRNQFTPDESSMHFYDKFLARLRAS